MNYVFESIIANKMKCSFNLSLIEWNEIVIKQERCRCIKFDLDSGCYCYISYIKDTGQ